MIQKNSDFDLGWPCEFREYATREEWLIGRRSVIGASDTAGIFGVGYANQSPLSVWDSKVGPPREDEEEDERLWIGSLMEPTLRAIFERKMGMPCNAVGATTILVHDQIPWLAATLDGVTLHARYGACPVELKNVDNFQRDQWKNGDAPLKYMVQVQQQLAVTGASHGYLMGLLGGNKPEIREIERNDRFIETMIARLAEFWGYVERREMPPIDRFPVDNYAATNKYLSAMWPEDNGASVVLPPEADEWIRQREDAKADIKAAEKQVDEAEAKIKAALGEATVGLFPCGSRVTWKTQTAHFKAKEAYEQVSRVLRYKAS